MSLKALKEEMVAFMMDNPPADTSVRCRLRSELMRRALFSLLTLFLLLCCHACCLYTEQANLPNPENARLRALMDTYEKRIKEYVTDIFQVEWWIRSM